MDSRAAAADDTRRWPGRCGGPRSREPMAKTLAWTEVSLGEFTALAADPDTLVYGSRPRLSSARCQTGGELPPRARMIPRASPGADDELPPGFTGGFHPRMPLMDMPRATWTTWSGGWAAAGGGSRKQHRVASSLAEAAEVAPVVVNRAPGWVPESWPAT